MLEPRVLVPKSGGYQRPVAAHACRDGQDLAPRIGDGTVRHRTFLLGSLGGIMLWSAFPPLGWSLVAWLAPVPWLILIRRDELSGRHPYRQLYGIGVLVWMAQIQWIRLPHWAGYFGWLALAIYLGAYLPLFVAMSRVLVHRYSISLLLAAPMVWTGLEFARSHALTGFSMLLLSHSQVRWPVMIQVADLAGASGLSFVMMLVAACLAEGYCLGLRRGAWRPALVALLAMTALVAYGFWRIPTGTLTSDGTLRIGLIQGSIDTTFDERTGHPREAHARYLALSQSALREDPGIDVVIWPESMYWQFDEPLPASAGPLWEITSEDQFLRAVSHAGAQTARSISRQLGVALLLGSPEFDVVGDQVLRFNSVLSIDRDGRIAGRYDKMHPVMFGEYIPLGKIFPWLYRLSPMGAGLTAGREPQCFEVEGVRFCPSICFENTVPHLIRRQVRRLQAAGHSPDVLVTVTNDGWFWGSSLLDHHLACGVFRAVEMRRPMLIAANTGFSAWIDAWGRIRAQGPRRAEGLVSADVGQNTLADSPYLRMGDCFPAGCLIASLLACGGLMIARIRPG